MRTGGAGRRELARNIVCLWHGPSHKYKYAHCRQCTPLSPSGHTVFGKIGRKCTLFGSTGGMQLRASQLHPGTGTANRRGGAERNLLPILTVSISPPGLKASIPMLKQSVCWRCGVLLCTLVLLAASEARPQDEK